MPFHRRVPRSILACLLAFALYHLGSVAATLPYWYDELLTVRISRLSSMTEIWSALTAGFDFNPPLNYVLTRIARTALPDADPLSARLPALAGLTLLMTGLFAALERRIGSWFALAAVAPVLLTGLAIGHSTDARPYVPLAGVAAWAFHFRGGTGPASHVGLAVTVAAALLLHVWGVLLLMALFAGEMVFAARHRHIRTGTLVALAASIPATTLYVPIVAGARDLIFANEVYAPTLDKLLQVFLDIRPPLRFAGAIVATAVAAGFWRNGSRRSSGGVALTLDETMVAALLLVSPLAPYFYAVITDGVFMPRYGALAIVGGVMLAGPCLRWLARGDERAGVLTAGVAVVSALISLTTRLDRNIPSEPTAVRSVQSAAFELDPTIPILLVNPTDLLPFDERAGDVWHQRSYYAADGAMALRYTGTNAIDVGYVRGAPYLNLRMRRLSIEELDRMSRVYLVGRQQALSWLPQYLGASGWVVTHVGGLPSCPIYLATRPDVVTPTSR